MRALSAERRIPGHQGARTSRKDRGGLPKSIRPWQRQKAVFRARSNGNLGNRACSPNALAFRTWFHTCYRRIRKLAWLAPDSAQLSYETDSRSATGSACLRVCNRSKRRSAQYGKPDKLNEVLLSRETRKSVTRHLVELHSAQSWASAPSRRIRPGLTCSGPTRADRADPNRQSSLRWSVAWAQDRRRHPWIRHVPT